MKLAKNKKAFTLIELMFVIVIISILTSLIAPHFIKSLSKANQVTDEANLKTLNSATFYCKFIEGEKFSDKYNSISSDHGRMDFLFSSGYIDNIPQTKDKKMSFFWEKNIEKWTIISRGKDKIAFTYIFDKDSSEKLKNEGKWIFSPEKKLYKVNLLLKLEEDNSAGGLLVDYSTEKHIDNEGFLVQLEKNNGQGSLVLREISNDQPGKAIIGYNFSHLNSLYIPDKRTDTGKLWWDSFHILSISIKEDRRLEVSIDYKLIFDDFYLPKLADRENLQTGIFLSEGNIVVKEIEIH